MKGAWKFSDILGKEMSTFGYDYPLQDLKATLDSAHELAYKAFVLNETDSRAYAERLLYLIHTMTGFTAPLQPKIAQIWQPLMRAKLQAEVQNYVDKDELSPEE